MARARRVDRLPSVQLKRTAQSLLREERVLLRQEDSAMKIENQQVQAPRPAMGSNDRSKLMRHYCGPIPFAGTDDAFYERHLVFDNVIELLAAGPRERFEAFARSVRDVLSQRWVHTERDLRTRESEAVYYLSMEFLIGRSLANNVTNLLLDPVAQASGQAREARLVRVARAGTRCGAG